MKLLYDQTDEDHYISVADILQFWQNNGILAGRKSVYSDIDLLMEMGVDIICIKSTQNRYFIGSRLFQVPELKLLVDAVESSHFITEKKSKTLIEKLGHLTNKYVANQLNRHIYMDGTTKPDNETIYYTIDEIQTAIQEKCPISFQYFEYTQDKKKVLKHDGYRGKYYTLTDQRIPYRRDKTEDERFFILTLFAIAHEIEAMGQYSGSLMRVQLAVGLPPAHFGVQAKRFINYFNGRGAVAFQFKGKPYAIFIENTACFPQSFSAAAATVKNLASFPRALVVDIGGFTADYVRLRNGVPDMAACDSLENGVILLYNRICAKANAELDILLEESEIDRILRGEDQDAAPEVIALAEREAQEFINDLLSGLRERMLELKSGKVIFLGGGATLLRRQIEASGKIGQAIFVEDINANAKGYEYLYRLQHSGR